MHRQQIERSREFHSTPDGYIIDKLKRLLYKAMRCLMGVYTARRPRRVFEKPLSNSRCISADLSLNLLESIPLVGIDLNI